MTKNIYTDAVNNIQAVSETATGGRNPVYVAQYKFLSKRSQLRVWVEKEKYEKFKRKVEQNGTSIYKLINRFVDSYIGEENGKEL